MEEYNRNHIHTRKYCKDRFCAELQCTFQAWFTAKIQSIHVTLFKYTFSVHLQWLCFRLKLPIGTDSAFTMRR